MEGTRSSILFSVRGDLIDLRNEEYAAIHVLVDPYGWRLRAHLDVPTATSVVTNRSEFTEEGALPVETINLSEEIVAEMRKDSPVIVC